MFLIYDSKTLREQDYAMHPIGTGPTLLPIMLFNSHIEMEKNDNYLGNSSAD